MINLTWDYSRCLNFISENIEDLLYKHYVMVNKEINIAEKDELKKEFPKLLKLKLTL